MNKMSRVSARILFAAVMTMACAAAGAQTLVKRERCSSANHHSGPGTGVYINGSGIAQYVMVQVVRDGCRPRGQDDVFELIVTSQTGETVYGTVPMRRNDRSTWAAQAAILDGRVARIRFRPADLEAKVSGTFDYIVQAD